MNPLLHSMLELSKSTDVSRIDDDPAMRAICSKEINMAIAMKKTAKVTIKKGHFRYLASDTSMPKRSGRPVDYAAFGKSSLGGGEMPILMP